MYEKLVIKTEYDKRVVMNVHHFQIIRYNEDTYLKCYLDGFDRTTLLIPFDNVIEITYDKSKYKGHRKENKKWREKK